MSEQDAPGTNDPITGGAANDPLEALKTAQEAIKAAQAMADTGAAKSSSPAPAAAPAMAMGAIGGPKVSDEEAEAQMLAAMGMSAAPSSPAPAAPSSAPPAPAPSASSAKAFAMPDLGGSPAARAPEAIDMLGDVNLHVKIELGRTRMLVEDVLRLGEGSVVELDKLAGDPVDVFVNDRPVARGEVLVLNDNFCVRISEIIRTQE
ncbi:MAG: flagellar motor switch protein FliN [Phycisphaerales bacterium]|nr:flagellar motor switch protein FliN [Phycisphaerales bacterium]